MFSHRSFNFYSFFFIIGSGETVGLKLMITTDLDSYVARIRSMNGVLFNALPSNDYGEMNKVSVVEPGTSTRNTAYPALVLSDDGVCFHRHFFYKSPYSLI